MNLAIWDIESSSASTDLLDQEINYKPKVTINQGIPLFIDWYKEYYKIQ